jgi:malonyl-CoA decarboxylase
LKPRNTQLIKMFENRCHSSLQSLVDTIITKAKESRTTENEVLKLCDSYYSSNRETKNKFLNYIADSLSVDVTQATNAINFYHSTKSRAEIQDSVIAIDKLRTHLKPRYLSLFNQIARIENGVKFIVDLRSDLMYAINDPIREKLDKVKMRSLNNQMRDLLSLWFSVGFLNLERITWNSPTSMLQKISEYEAVHPMRNWTDLKRRVGQYRRCYVFSHSCLQSEPLVILHVALMSSISSSIQDIIKRTNITPIISDTLSALPIESFGVKEDPDLINAAIFYSISSTQNGLHGIDLGNQLIKRVVRQIRSEFPLLSQFSSLSPIPNFCEYLLLEIQAIQKGDSAKESTFVTKNELSLLKKHLLGKDSENSDIWPNLMRQFKTNSWINDEKLTKLLYSPLMRKCAHYLYNEKRRGYALNSVAHFHLRNGAVMWRLNWMADLSPRGLSNSCGIMINYRYFLEKAENNSHLYIEDKHIVADEQVLNWIKPFSSQL